MELSETRQRLESERVEKDKVKNQWAIEHLWTGASMLTSQLMTCKIMYMYMYCTCHVNKPIEVLVVDSYLVFSQLSRELSSEHQRGRELEVEVNLKREEVEGYRTKLATQHSGGRGLGVVGVVEEELRERLKTQERDMAEQLDRIEVTEKEKERELFTYVPF